MRHILTAARNHSFFLKILRPSLAVAVWMLCSIALILCNGFILKTFKFKFPLYLTFVQSAAISICLKVLYALSARSNPYKGGIMTMYRTHIAPIAAMFACSILLRNLVYLYLSIAAMQMIAACAPVLVYMVSCALGAEKLTRPLTMSVIGVCIGVVTASSGPINIVWQGVALQVVAIVIEAFRSLRLKEVVSCNDNNKVDSIDVLYLLMPTTAAMLYIPAAVVDFESVLQYTIVNTAAIHAFLLLNVLLAGALNLASIHMLSNVSVLTASLSGVLKDCLIVGYSVYRGDETFTALNIAGWAMSAGCLCWYALLRNRTPA